VSCVEPDRGVSAAVWMPSSRVRRDTGAAGRRSRRVISLAEAQVSIDACRARMRPAGEPMIARTLLRGHDEWLTI
jgi:hypothetical protein